jgi:selenocysteine lyase/cysteine desulfurase
VQFGTGFRADLQAWADFAHAHNAIFVVDVIQGLGVLPLEAEALGLDVVATGVHKWLLSPGGTGGLYIAPHIMERMRLVNMGAISVVDYARFDPLVFSPKPTAQRYEEGTPNVLGLVGLDAGLSLLEEVGIAQIAPRVLDLGRYAGKALTTRGYRVFSPHGDDQRAGIVLFGHERHDNDTIVSALERARVAVAVRGGRVRFSPHFYNTEEDIDRAVAALP